MVVLFSRIALGLTTGLALVMAMSADNIIGYISDMISLFITGMCVCGVLGKLWPRYNAPGAIASLIGAFATALTFRFQPAWTEYWGGSILPALVVSTGLGIVVSLLTPREKRTQEEVVEMLNRKREVMSDSA